VHPPAAASIELGGAEFGANDLPVYGARVLAPLENKSACQQRELDNHEEELEDHTVASPATVARLRLRHKKPSGFTSHYVGLPGKRDLR
jgi:hypothetical protein